MWDEGPKKKDAGGPLARRLPLDGCFLSAGRGPRHGLIIARAALLSGGGSAQVPIRTSF